MFYLQVEEFPINHYFFIPIQETIWITLIG